MLQNIWLKTIRDNWKAIMGWGVGLGLIIGLNLIAYAAQYPTAADRLKAAQALAPLLQSFRFLLGEPVDVSTPGGFLTWRIVGIMPVLLGIWAALSVTGSTRGEEESGTADLLVTTPHSRANVLLQKWLGYSLSLLAILLLAWLITYVSGLVANADVGSVASLLTMLNIGLLAWFWGGLALLAAQFVRSRAGAAAIAIGLMLFTYLLNNIAGSLDSTRWLVYASPFFYTSINKPLVPGSSVDPLAFSVAPLLALVCLGLAVALYQRRDSGSTVQLGTGRPQTAPLAAINWRERLLDNLFVKSLRDVRLGLFCWGLGLALYCGYVAGLANLLLPVIKSMLGSSNSPLSRFAGQVLTGNDLVAVSLFSFLPLLLAGYALTQVAGWAGEEESGRLEVTLTTPQSRPQVILARFGVIALTSTLIAVVAGLGILIGAAVGGTDLDGGKIVAGVVSLVPFILVVAAAGFALAAWLQRPGAAVAFIGVLVIVSYFLELLAPALKWPTFVQGLSIFHQYGSPARTGFDASGFSILTVAAVVLLASAVVGFQRRDIAKLGACREGEPHWWLPLLLQAAC